MTISWHARSLEEVFRALGTDERGLSRKDAGRRLAEYGKNILPREKPYSKLALFLSQFNTPLIYILLGAVLISLSLKHYSDTIFIAVVLFINTVLGFWQENKAHQTFQSLQKMVRARAHVLRDGNKKEIDGEELVPGDIVLLKSGDKVPADGRIMESRGLKVNESILTGEWMAVEKNPMVLPEDTALPDRQNMIFMGTIVEEGWARTVVVATGKTTETGTVLSLLREAKETKTPLQERMTHLSGLLGVFILISVALITLIGYFKEKSFAEIFLASLALAVSTIPEGLLPAITVILVLGMRRIQKENGLVRKLIAAETLGSVTVIATDKTGTLTQGKMQVSHILTSTHELLHDEKEGFSKVVRESNGMESHIVALKIATLASEAFVENPDAELEKWIIRGRPTEQALLLAGIYAGLDKNELERELPVLDHVSFDANLKYSATLHTVSAKENILYAVGAPEELIGLSVELDIDGRRERLGSSEAKKLFMKLEDMTARGLRVLSCAYRRLPAEKTEYKTLAELVQKLTFVGFIALKDPLRRDAKAAIALTKKAGIRTILVTGDHKLTAKAIAEELGLEVGERDVLEGKDLEAMPDEELEENAKHTVIYARVSPAHKLRIVQALRKNGERVAMVGDGVNDAPALKSAGIGVAVGSGTDVAKEVADLVLLDDSFATIVNAVEQGRIIFDNIRKVLVYLVADDFSELILFLGSMAMGLPLPLLPAQILWINLVEDGVPASALTAEEEVRGVMEEKPRSPEEPIIHTPLRHWMAVVFFITAIAALLTFIVFLRLTGNLEKTRSVVFSLMVLDSLFFAFSTRSFKKSVFRRDIFSNLYLTGAVLLSLLLLFLGIYFPPLQRLLDTRALGPADWGLIAAIAFAEFIVIELTKAKIFRPRLSTRK